MVAALPCSSAAGHVGLPFRRRQPLFPSISPTPPLPQFGRLPFWPPPSFAHSHHHRPSLPCGVGLAAVERGARLRWKYSGVCRSNNFPQVAPNPGVLELKKPKEKNPWEDQAIPPPDE